MPNNLRVTTERTVFLVVRFLLLLGMLTTICLAGVVMYAIQPASSDPAELTQLIAVTSGMTGRDIALLLEERGIVDDALLFRLLVRLTGTEHHLQAGHYLLNPNMDSMEIIEQLRTGKTVTERVVIPEGFELKQIAKLLADKGLVDYDRFLALASSAEAVFGEALPIDLPIDTLEGYLFPDTYYFSFGQSEADIIGQMVYRFVEVIDEHVSDALKQSDLTLHEVVTLASIVEREIMVDWERPLVASVYLNRLAINMPLQADPTVRYVMTEDRSRVLYRDLEIDSPYNTYRNRGLPPGPIASPGLASILAVLNPADEDYLYFVSKRDGTHQFSRTFNEHVRARRALGY